MKKIPRFWLALWALMLLLALWHFLDVRAGAAASGDGWLIGWYGVLVAMVFLGTGVGVVLFLSPAGKARWPLERLYPLAGLFLGTLYLFVLPPFSAPDEVVHYISSYQVSSRMLGRRAEDSDGSVLIRGADWFLEDVYGNYEYEAGEGRAFRVAGEQQEDRPWKALGQEMEEETYRMIHDIGWKGGKTPQEVRFWEIGIQDAKRETAASRYRPVATTPLAYVPQAVGISLARVLGLDSIWLAYLGRFCNLLFFVAMTTAAMRRLPFGKELLFGVALLPMTMHLSASFSYDVMILGCFFYLTALCLDLAWSKEQVGIRDVAALMALMAAAGPCKMVYGLMAGLCLLIPVKKFGGWARWGCAALAVIGAWVLALAVINSQVVVNLVGAQEPVVAWADEAGYSVGFLLHNPKRLAQMFYQTMLWEAQNYHLTMIGMYLGGLDLGLDVPYLLVMAFTGCLIGLALKKPGESLALAGGKRLWVFAVCLGCAAAILASMLIAWTPVGSPVIMGVQGRYFLPFLPVFLMACKNDGLILTKALNRSILYLMFCINGYVLFRLFSIVSMRG